MDHSAFDLNALLALVSSAGFPPEVVDDIGIRLILDESDFCADIVSPGVNILLVGNIYSYEGNANVFNPGKETIEAMEER